MSWLSKKLKKSKRKGTGIFSWGKSKVVTSGLKLIPGVGKTLSDLASKNLVKGKSSSPSSIVRIKNL